MVRSPNIFDFFIGSPEAFSREFGLSERALLVQRLQQRRLREGEDPEAEICWGGTATFNFATSEPVTNGVSVTIEENDDPPLEKEVLVFDEVTGTRKETPLRVENPDDPEQYVMVMRIDNITFEGPDGICRQFVLHHPDR